MMPRLYIVKWLDSWHNTGYYRQGDDCEKMISYDVGYLMEENDEGFNLVSSFIKSTRDGRHVSFFPWEMIVSIEELI